MRKLDLAEILIIFIRYIQVNNFVSSRGVADFYRIYENSLIHIFN